MPLAGSMKLRTFLTLVGAGGALLLGVVGVGGYFGWSELDRQWEEQREQERLRLAEDAERQRQAEAERQARIVEREQRAAERAEEARLEQERIRAEMIAQGIDPDAKPAIQPLLAATDVEAPPQAPTRPDQRAVDGVVSRHLGRDLGSSKLKDVTKGQPYKVNVYQDDGNRVANRAKIDLDRDDKWDEKWTFKDGGISRQVAPNDDENYTITEVWQDGGWVRQ